MMNDLVDFVRESIDGGWHEVSERGSLRLLCEGSGC